MRRVVVGASVVLALSVTLLAIFDVDISGHRYLAGDVLFRSASVPAPSSVVPYRFYDPSPYSIWIPSDQFVRDRIATGKLALWNRLQGGGYSPLLHFQGGVLFPLRWLSALAPDRQEESMLHLMTICLCFLGCFLLFLKLGVSEGGSIFGGMIFSLSSHSFSMMYFGGLEVYLFCPWLLLAYWTWADAPSAATFASLAIVGALLLTAGHPGYILATVVVASAAILGDLIVGRRRIPSRSSLAGLALAVISSFAIAAAALLPFARGWSGLWTYKTDTEHVYRLYQPFSLAEWVEQIRSMLIGSENVYIADQAPFFNYLGVPVTAVALLGLIGARQNRELRFLWILVPFAFALSIPGPWMEFVRLIPVIGYFKVWYYYVALTFSASCAASLGLDAIRRAVPGPGTLKVGLVLSVILAVALSYVFRTLDLWTPAEARGLPKSGGYEFLSKDKELYRITGLWGHVHLPNLSAISGIEDLRISSPMLSRRYHEWFLLLDPEIMARTFPTVRVTDRLGSPLLGAFNVKYVLRGRQPFTHFHTHLTEEDPFRSFSPEAASIREEEMTRVYRDEFVEIYRNDHGFKPRAYFAENVEIVAPGERNAAEWIRTHPDRVASTVVVETSDGELMRRIQEHRAPTVASVEVEYPDQERVEMVSKSDTTALLVLSDVYEDGWEATIDGIAAPIVPANVLGRGVLVDSGQHAISMTYTPPGFRAGVIISLVTLAAMMVMLLRARGAPRT